MSGPNLNLKDRPWCQQLLGIAAFLFGGLVTFHALSGGRPWIPELVEGLWFLTSGLYFVARGQVILRRVLGVAAFLVGAPVTFGALSGGRLLSLELVLGVLILSAGIYLAVKEQAWLLRLLGVAAILIGPPVMVDALLRGRLLSVELLMGVLLLATGFYLAIRNQPWLRQLLGLNAFFVGALITFHALSTGRPLSLELFEGVLFMAAGLYLAWSLLAPLTGLLVVLLLFAVVFPVVYPALHSHLSESWQLSVPDRPFVTMPRLTLITSQTATVAMGALGMTVIIISGGIDLSVGSLLALTSVCLAMLLTLGFDPVLAVLLVLCIGTAAGALNGVLITRLRLVPFIVTLGTMLVYRGLAHRIANQQKIQAEAPDWIATLLLTPSQDSMQLISTGCWMVVLLGIVVALVLRYTVFGRYVYALGSNEATARLCGVNVPLMKIAVYAVGGFFMAISGIFDFSYLNLQGDPTSGDALELKIIAAVVIGGGSLSGGRGSILGSIVGALTMTTLTTGCVYVGVGDPVQKMIIGSIIIAAVAIDQFLHRRRN